MNVVVLGWPPDGVSLQLHHEEFAYAGKFVMTDTGKAIVHEDGDIIAAASFNLDRTTPSIARIRYITVRDDRREAGIGSRLLATLRTTLRDAVVDTVAIAVNNPFAFEAAYRGGFAWDGTTTGLRELLLRSDVPRDTPQYRRGFSHFAYPSTTSDAERTFIETKREETPPSVVAPFPRSQCVVPHDYGGGNKTPHHMGNSALRELAVIDDVPFEELDGSVIAVDAHNWLYRYLTTTVRWTDDEVYTGPDGQEVPNLIGIVTGLPKFFEHGIHPVFVFDGAVVDLKEDELADRRESREAAEDRLAEAIEADDQIEAARLKAQTQRLTPIIQETTRELFDILDVPVIEAPAEGEAQAAHMARTGAVDYVGTEDYDALLFGAPLTVRQVTSKGNPELMNLAETLDELGITHEQLVDIAILIGTDFNEGISGFGPKTALDRVRELGDLEAVLEAEGTSLPVAPRVRELFLEPTVTDEYTIETNVSPNVAGARTYLTEHWDIPDSEIETGLDRLESALTQTGLDQWS